MEDPGRLYDNIGVGYRRRRRPDPRIAARIWEALGEARTVCNVGAGAGSYEPEDRDVIAVEPSDTMIAQRHSARPAVRATAEQLPFSDQAFDAAMAVLTVHHWRDPRAGLREMKRVSKRQVVFAFDVDQIDLLWLARDYLPEAIAFDRQRATPIGEIATALQSGRVETVPIPHDCQDGFLGAYWRRPEAYLQPDVRAAISTFSQLPADVVQRAIDKLASDLQSGRWQSRYGQLLEHESLDLGYRLVCGP